MKIMPIKDALGLPRLFDFSAPLSPAPELILRGLYPPLPVLLSREAGTGAKTLVWGRALLEAARSVGAETVTVNEIEEKDLPPAEALRVFLLLENRRDCYSWEEMEGIAAYIEKTGISDDGTIAGLVSSELRHIPRYQKLRPASRRLVASSKIDLKTAEALASLPDAALEAPAPLLGSLSFSERRIFLKTLAEIIKRDRLDESAALALCRGLLDEKNPLDKLHKLRYPELSGLEERFSAAAARALKGSGVTLKPPPFFEGLRYGISFEFDGGRALKKKIKALENLAAEEDELFALL